MCVFCLVCERRGPRCLQTLTDVPEASERRAAAFRGSDALTTTIKVPYDAEIYFVVRQRRTEKSASGSQPFVRSQKGNNSTPRQAEQEVERKKYLCVEAVNRGLSKGGGGVSFKKGFGN